MKRWLSLLLALVLSLALAGCAGKKTPAAPAQTPPQTTQTPQQTQEIPFATLPVIESGEPAQTPPPDVPDDPEPALSEDGVYDSRDEVALYLHLYGHLPSNYITKSEAEALGWPGGDLTPYAPGKCIGGGRFGNYEGALPAAKGRSYRECDIDTLGKKSRGAKRLVYSNDGLIYYTADHYETFELLYGEE